MDAKRWSPLWVFVGGCLTGAAVIGLQARGDGEPRNAEPAKAASDSGALSSKAGSVEESVRAQPATAEAPGQGDAPARTQATSQADAVEREKAEGGNSVAEVLARLEGEYRQRSAPASPASDGAAHALPKEPPREVAEDAARSVKNEMSASKPASEQAVAVRAAPAAEAAVADARLAIVGDTRVASAADVRVATVGDARLADDAKRAASVSEEAARLASLREEQAKAFDTGQQQVATQMQQLAALQQATLVEQAALLQYLQLLSLPGASRANVTPVPSRSQRPGRGARIVASLPPSISDMDNPWGFELQPSVLVR
jgi:hypothetical protein